MPVAPCSRVPVAISAGVRGLNRPSGHACVGRLTQAMQTALRGVSAARVHGWVQSEIGRASTEVTRVFGGRERNV